jgi:DNA polymerase (family 10)
MSNLEISTLFRNIAASYTIKDEAKFRFQIIAYEKAAETVAGLTTEISEYYKNNELDTLPGIGKTIRSHLDELFKTGTVKQFEWAKSDIPEAVFPLLDIPSFGPKKAYKLVKQFNFKNSATVIADLEAVAKQGLIAPLDGFGEKSQSDILMAITEFRLGKGKTSRMTLPYAMELSEKIVNYLKVSDVVIRAEPLGSLRRCMPTVGDIDIAVATKKPKQVIDYFVSYPATERIIEKGETSASILAVGGKQVDLMTQQPDGFGSLLQHFTGSKNHNVHLRELALKKGFSLSEYGIKLKSNASSSINKYETEEQFYNAIGLQWIPPEIREDTGEIELAKSNQLPKLVELKEIKGDLHLHSNFPIQPSHDLGISSFKEMLATAKELKYKYLGFSEHNPSISKHNDKSTYELISKRNDNIEQILSGNKDVQVFKLLEIDILPNGLLAIDEKSLELLDGAIVSIHSVFNMNIEQMTQRVINGLSHRKAKILAHPTGRLLNERTGYNLNWEKIFAFCKKYDKALEINSWPLRLDLPDSLIRKAVEANVKLIINSDSHANDQMNLMKFGVATAKRGWATKDDILNTLSYNEFSKWLEK